MHFSACQLYLNRLATLQVPFFIETQFTFHKIHPFKVYNSVIFSIFTEQPPPLARTFSSPWKVTLYPLTVASHSPKSSFWQLLIYFLSLWTCWFQTCVARIRVFEAGPVTGPPGEGAHSPPRTEISLFVPGFGWLPRASVTPVGDSPFASTSFFKNIFIYLAAPSLSCGTWDLSLWLPRPTQSSGNAPSSPVEDDEQGCTQAGGREGILQGQCGKPITETQKKMHVQAQVQQDSVWKWIQNGAVIGCLEEEREHLEVTHTPMSLPPSCPDTASWSALSPFTPTAWERCGPGDTWGRARVVGEPTLQRQWGWDWPGPTDASSAII